jgi:hypothetical protein
MMFQRERVRRDHLDVRLDQVVPAGDVLRIAVADDEHDVRVRDDPVVLVLIPVGADQLRVDEPCDVRLEREVDDVGGLPGGHRPALVAGGAVRLCERDFLARRRLVEGGNQLRVRRFGRRVGDQVDLPVGRSVGGAPAAAAAARCQGGQREEDGPGRCDPYLYSVQLFSFVYRLS